MHHFHFTVVFFYFPYLIRAFFEILIEFKLNTHTLKKRTNKKLKNQSEQQFWTKYLVMFVGYHGIPMIENKKITKRKLNNKRQRNTFLLESKRRMSDERDDAQVHLHFYPLYSRSLSTVLLFSTSVFFFLFFFSYCLHPFSLCLSFDELATYFI